jgi:hypothetical protein
MDGEEVATSAGGQGVDDVRDRLATPLHLLAGVVQTKPVLRKSVSESRAQDTGAQGRGYRSAERLFFSDASSLASASLRWRKKALSFTVA